MRPITLAAVFLLSWMSVSHGLPLAFAGSQSLGAEVAFNTKANTYYLRLTNRSPYFICVSPDDLDTKRGNITLLDYDGKRVALHRYYETALGGTTGFDFDQPYSFIRPGETREFDFDAHNFAANSGHYRYQILFPYYRCSDISDVLRENMGRPIVQYVFRSTGDWKWLFEK